MSFTKQEMTDWALSRQNLEPATKLLLVTLAFNADGAGDGVVRVGHLSTSMRNDALDLVGRLTHLRACGLIVFTYKSKRGAYYMDDEIVYGICIDMGL